MIEATIKQTAPNTVAFKVMRGPYAQIPEGFRKLYEWVEHYGLQPAGMPEALYLTDPKATPEEEAEWEVWAPIAGGPGQTGPDDEGFGVKRIEPETIAAATHVGPYREIAPVYDELSHWLTEQGYSMVGPPREVYLSGPEVPEAEQMTEVQMPVSHV